jgi:hypothetical protein
VPTAVALEPGKADELGVKDARLEEISGLAFLFGVENNPRQLIDTIEVPERPLQIAFGGADGRTLFIPARTSLYSVRLRHPGR